MKMKEGKQTKVKTSRATLEIQKNTKMGGWMSFEGKKRVLIDKKWGQEHAEAGQLWVMDLLDKGNFYIGFPKKLHITDQTFNTEGEYLYVESGKWWNKKFYLSDSEISKNIMVFKSSNEKDLVPSDERNQFISKVFSKNPSAKIKTRVIVRFDLGFTEKDVVITNKSLPIGYFVEWGFIKRREAIKLMK